MKNENKTLINITELIEEINTLKDQVDHLEEKLYEIESSLNTPPDIDTYIAQGPRTVKF